mgnify:CR=1 FL=1
MQTSDTNQDTVPDKRILVVDDDRAIRDMFLRVLSYKLPNCHIDVAVSGDEAVSSFRSSYYDVVLLDMRMPEMNGDAAYHAIENVCRAEGNQPPAVVFITGFEPSAAIKDIVRNDKRHCLLRKPVRKHILLNALRSRLSELPGDPTPGQPQPVPS